MMVILQDMPNVIGNVLVDKNDTNIISSGKDLKGLLDLLKFRVRLANQKVRALCSPVPDACQQETRDRVLSRITSKQTVSSMRRIPTNCHKNNAKKKKGKDSVSQRKAFGQMEFRRTDRRNAKDLLACA
jgi:hypothetical protein